MTREEFIEDYAANSGLEVQVKSAKLGLVDFGGAPLIAMPCACGECGCRGWAMVFPDMILHHLQFQAPAELRAAYLKALDDCGGA
jgi:hypothetical protein